MMLIDVYCRFNRVRGMEVCVGIWVLIRVVKISLFMKLILKFIIYWYGGLDFVGVEEILMRGEK